jgi:hypothetical protein
MVTINGTNLTDVLAVTFGGTDAEMYYWNSYGLSIIAFVGNGSSGEVSVTTPDGTASMPGFIYAAPPEISAFSPASAANGEAVTITGSGFIGATSVSFGGLTPSAGFQLDSDTQITATVDAAPQEMSA